MLGAHPDDAEFHAGGLLWRHCQRGNTVRLVSVTDGSAGHHQRTAESLRDLRRKEAHEAGQVLGAEYHVWEFPDGLLQPTLELRHRIIAEVRRFAPDLLLTHRTNDYHPDHRAVGQAVQDASFLFTVPKIVPEAPALRRDPVVAYMNDLFTRPIPLRPDVTLPLATQEIDVIVAMLACHRSQVFEWLPYVQNLPPDAVPECSAERLAWLKGWYLQRARAVADTFRSALVEQFGAAIARNVAYAEAYEISEYAGRLDPARRDDYFPPGKEAAGSLVDAPTNDFQSA